MMHPLVFNLKGRKLLFIGGGKVAVRKIKSLMHTGADITVIAPETEPMPDGVRILNKLFEENDITDEYFLVFACTDSKEINKTAAEKAKSLRIPVNIADDPQNSDFHMPSVIMNESYTISVSTDGRSPSEAKSMREKLEAIIKNNNELI